jgi:hypothetical protein
MTKRPKNRYARLKAKAKQVVMHASFNGWENDTHEELAKRIDKLLHITVYEHRFIEPEWQAIDAMRDKLKTLEKFQQAVREAQQKGARRVPAP